MPVLFKEISDDLGLNLVQIGVVWGITGLAGLFFSLPSGLIGDKYGATRTLGVACLLQGIVGALRGISGGFTGLSVYMFLFGLFGVPMSFTTHQAAGQWFSGRQLGFANGVLAMGMGVGTTVGSLISATVLSPWLGGWRNLMFVYGAITIVISLLWFKARHSLPGQGEAVQDRVPFRQALSHVIRIRSVWLTALTLMFLAAYGNGVIGYLPLYLRSIGWSQFGADGALATLSAVSVVSCVPLSILSDRIGSRKVVIYPAIIIGIIGVGLLAVFTGPMVWLSVVLTGAVREGLFAMLMTMVMEEKGIGATYYGTALGVAMSLAFLGNLIGPPIGNRLAVIDPSFAFIFWSGLAAAALISFCFAAETGWKRRAIQP
ncbi:MAG: hypothetical protein A2144_12795 [Chloroflexi bacterium RBG_16_50_9]|nr:MAG: hypothetical protein A2144_12795 [Chloroflexi bacterium RBG_16_50_9]